MPSELRKDIISGDWILISTVRAARPSDFKKKSGKIVRTPISKCVFENPAEASNGIVIASYPKNTKNWTIQVVPNKYPAVTYPYSDKLLVEISKGKHGPYPTILGIGHHELVITKDHDNSFPDLPNSEAYRLLKVFRDRYNSYKNDPNIDYVAVFHNWGEKAGASIYHPHYQILTLPVIPPDIHHSLHGSQKYFDKNKRCAHCDMIAYEKKEKSRIIAENKGAVVFAPFVSRVPFEMRVFPKKHTAFFEDSSDSTLRDVAYVMQKALKKLNFALKPNYNFFIHSAPLKNESNHSHYHWHIEILPKFSHYAGFELETGVTINVVDPNDAAKIINRTK